MRSWTWYEEEDGEPYVIAAFRGLMGGTKRREKYDGVKMGRDGQASLFDSTLDMSGGNTDGGAARSRASNSTGRNMDGSGADEIRIGEGEIETADPSFSTGSNRVDRGRVHNGARRNGENQVATFRPKHFS